MQSIATILTITTAIIITTATIITTANINNQYTSPTVTTMCT